VQQQRKGKLLFQLRDKKERTEVRLRIAENNVARWAKEQEEERQKLEALEARVAEAQQELSEVLAKMAAECQQGASDSEQSDGEMADDISDPDLDDGAKAVQRKRAAGDNGGLLKANPKAHGKARRAAPDGTAVGVMGSA
jgi:hypothetical protein